MYKFSENSKNHLATCDPRLVAICNLALEITPHDFSIICGHRDAFDQNKAYAEGHSGVKFPNSLHNKFPSLAVDIAPYPLDWDDIIGFKVIGSAMFIAAYNLNITDLVWGAFWKEPPWDKKTDWGHFQISST